MLSTAKATASSVTEALDDFATEVQRLSSGKRMDATTPQDVRDRILSAGHGILRAEGALLGLPTTLEAQSKQLEALQTAQEIVREKHAAVWRQTQTAASVVSDLEEAIFAAQQELARPTKTVAVGDVVSVAAQLGHSLSAPFGWMPPAPLQPSLFYCPLSSEMAATMIKQLDVLHQQGLGQDNDDTALPPALNNGTEALPPPLDNGVEPPPPAKRVRVE